MEASPTAGLVAWGVWTAYSISLFGIITHTFVREGWWHH
jgi:hypothetical protein